MEMPLPTLSSTLPDGYFVVNGVRQASDVELNLTAAQLAQTTYVSLQLRTTIRKRLMAPLERL
jgi:hypothetical protein